MLLPVPRLSHTWRCTFGIAALRDCGGQSRGGRYRTVAAFPYLAGQKETYLYESLRHFATGDRKSGIMQPIAGGLFDAAMQDIASHYANAKPGASPPHVVLDPDRIERGQRIAATGLQRQQVPSCVHCHGPGNVAVNPAFPHLAGQNEDYLVQQLKLWQSGTRGGTAYAPLMTSIAAGLTPAEIGDVAAYYASLPFFTPPRQ